MDSLDTIGSSAKARLPRVIASWADIPSRLAWNSQFVGGKAKGLFRLPQQWVPPFIALTSDFFRRACGQASIADAIESLEEQDATKLAEFLSLASRKRILVRSNAPDENLENRGAYRSYPVECDRDSIVHAISTITESAQAPMFAILQLAIEPSSLGHMSNERRVTARQDRWLVEGLSGAGKTERGQQFIRVTKRKSDSGALFARNENEVVSCLRAVAGYLLQMGEGQYHCEWAWDGRRLWIVQCDDASLTMHQSGAAPANTYLTSVEPWIRDRHNPQPPILPFCDTTNEWAKLERPKTFKQFGLPTGDVYFLSGSAWVNASQEQRAQLSLAICKISDQPIVVRCDITKAARGDDLLLPTSPASGDASDIAGYMDRAAAFFSTRGIRASEWAFLIAGLVPARASAMVHTFPGAQHVRVDALWGYPDGLLHYAHDTYFYYPKENRIDICIRYKGACVLPEGADWSSLTIAPPLDWEQVLSAEEIKTAGDWALQLADGLQRQIQLMTLARIGGRRGSCACLPWHYTAFDVPRYMNSLRALTEYSGIEIVGNYDDLDRLRQRGSDGTIRGYRIRPSETLLRDDRFLVEAATFASRQGKPIYFEGSVLGHAYYVMARTGATVVPVIAEPKPHRRVYNKLVRDHIPMVIQQAGGLARVRKVPRSEVKGLLVQKLIEEAFEAWSALQSDLVEELADIMDVVEALLLDLGIDSKAFSAVRSKKKTRRGGFSELMYLEETDIGSLKMPSDNLGHLPLFGDEPRLPSRPKRDRKQDFVRIDHFGNQTDLAQLSISLVPPVGGGQIDVVMDLSEDSSGRSAPASPSEPRWLLSSRKIRVEACYAGSRVTVRLVPVTPVAEIDRTTQLTLPFVDINEMDSIGVEKTDSREIDDAEKGNSIDRNGARCG